MVRINNRAQLTIFFNPAEPEPREAIPTTSKIVLTMLLKPMKQERVLTPGLTYVHHLIPGIEHIYPDLISKIDWFH